MRIAKKDSLPEESAGMMTVVVMRPYARLEKELRSVFKGQEDVKVISDKRYGERRKRLQAVTKECRKDDRRRPKEELVEVAIST
jgi:hypothetical protein